MARAKIAEKVTAFDIGRTDLIKLYVEMKENGSWLTGIAVGRDALLKPKRSCAQIGSTAVYQRLNRRAPRPLHPTKRQNLQILWLLHYCTSLCHGMEFGTCASPVPIVEFVGSCGYVAQRLQYPAPVPAMSLHLSNSAEQEVSSSDCDSRI